MSRGSRGQDAWLHILRHDEDMQEVSATSNSARRSGRAQTTQGGGTRSGGRSGVPSVSRNRGRGQTRPPVRPPSHGGGGSGFFGDDALGALRRTRAPQDMPPHDDDEIEGPCFMCAHVGVRAGAPQQGGYLGEQDLCDAYDGLKRLIDENRAADPRVLVDMAFEFYEKEIRPHYEGLGAWTRRSIWSHVTRHAPAGSDIVLDDMERIMLNQIESLRCVSWTVDESGNSTPNVRELQLLERYISSFAAMSTRRAARR